MHSADGWREVPEPVVARCRDKMRRRCFRGDLANFLRTLAPPAEAAQWSNSTLRERLVKIGVKIVRHGRSITFQMAAVTTPRDLFQKLLRVIAALRPLPVVVC